MVGTHRLLSPLLISWARAQSSIKLIVKLQHHFFSPGLPPCTKCVVISFNLDNSFISSIRSRSARRRVSNKCSSVLLGTLESSNTPNLFWHIIRFRLVLRSLPKEFCLSSFRSAKLDTSSHKVTAFFDLIYSLTASAYFRLGFISSSNTFFLFLTINPSITA